MSFNSLFAFLFSFVFLILSSALEWKIRSKKHELKYIYVIFNDTVPVQTFSSVLRFPHYKPPPSRNISIIVWPVRELLSFTAPMLQPVKETGIVFYVYSKDGCKHGNHYMDQVERNAKAILAIEPNASIALITNCDVPISIAQYLTIIVPVSWPDVLNVAGSSWVTRVLYNAYLPFSYSFILDTHVFPCHANSYSKLFSLFMHSGVDVSASCREGDRLYPSGGAILSKWGSKSHSFWKAVYQRITSCGGCDDQSAILDVLKNSLHPEWKYMWMSSNWFFASHGINENGFFAGVARCYRSSVIITGPVEWIHGDPSECALMNGPNDSIAYRKRVYFMKGNCSMKGKGPIVAFSKEELSQLVAPYKATHLQWNTTHSSDSLFWKL